MLGQFPITIKDVFENESIAGLETLTQSGSIDLLTTTANGILSVSIELVSTNAPEIDVYVLSSYDGINFVKDSVGYKVVESFFKTSGVDTDGKDILLVRPVLSRYVKFVVKELANESGTITLKIARQ